jgi:hypothetical protein
MYTIVKNELGVEWVVRDNGDETISWIPMDESNSDYQAYLAWLEDPEAENTPPIL